LRRAFAEVKQTDLVHNDTGVASFDRPVLEVAAVGVPAGVDLRRDALPCFLMLAASTRASLPKKTVATDRRFIDPYQVMWSWAANRRTMQKEKIRHLAHDLLEHFGAFAHAEAVERYTLMLAMSLDDGARLWRAVAEEVEDLSSADVARAGVAR